VCLVFVISFLGHVHLCNAKTRNVFNIYYLDVTTLNIIKSSLLKKPVFFTSSKFAIPFTLFPWLVLMGGFTTAVTEVGLGPLVRSKGRQ
jgi:hypothetical protein